MPTTNRERLDLVLDRIVAEAHPAFVAVDAARARAEADAADARRREGRALGPVDGWIVPVKDLLDVAGEVTRAGAALRRDAPPATEDAVVVRRLRAAGAILLGRTHMSEFAFSGLGLNPWDPPLGNALDKRRVPGGSSSGAAVAVAEGLADAAIGTDTGGSCRIPAALNGVVGMKPSHGLVPTEGCFPLSASLDTIGPLAPNVAACAASFEAMSGVAAPLGAPPAPSELRLGALHGAFLKDAEAAVAASYEAALGRISAAGASVTPLSLDDAWDAMLGAFPAPLVAIEAAAVHQEALRARRDAFDPRVAARIALGMDARAADYVNGLAERRRLVGEVAATLGAFDAVLSPTVPITAPEIAPLAADDALFLRANLLMLRNPSFANLFDLCALNLPLRLSETASVGITLAAAKGADARLLAVAAALEPAATEA